MIIPGVPRDGDRSIEGGGGVGEGCINAKLTLGFKYFLRHAADLSGMSSRRVASSHLLFAYACLRGSGRVNISTMIGVYVEIIQGSLPPLCTNKLASVLPWL